MTDKSHLWYLVRLWWHLLEASVYAIDSHNTAAAAWGTFSEIFSHHFPGPQTSIDFSAARMLSFFYLDRTVTAFYIVNTKLCLMDRDPPRSRSLFLKASSLPVHLCPRSSFRRALSLNRWGFQFVNNDSTYHLSPRSSISTPIWWPTIVTDIWNLRRKWSKLHVIYFSILIINWTAMM